MGCTTHATTVVPQVVLSDSLLLTIAQNLFISSKTLFVYEVAKVFLLMFGVPILQASEVGEEGSDLLRQPHELLDTRTQVRPPLQL